MEHKCVKCNNSLYKCLALGGTYAVFAFKLPRKIFTKKESSQLFPYVCSNCGYTEWYADTPENLKY